MEPRFKFSLGYFLMLFALMLFLDSVFFSGPAVHEISYSDFRDLLREDKVQSVILEQDRIYGLDKPFAKVNTSTTEHADSKGSAGFTPLDHPLRTLFSCMVLDLASNRQGSQLSEYRQEQS
jgi:hypothetical protein